mgnify:CR=1 FL=1
MKHATEQAHPFAIVPVEVMMDNRLTLETMRVLVTLFSFRNKTTGLIFPHREALSERCGMHPSNISAATTKLVELGWLKKEGAGGYGKATNYTIVIPETVADLAIVYKERSEARKTKRVAEQATVVQSTTVAEQAAPSVAQPATSTVAQSTTRIKATDKGTNQLTDISLPDKSGEVAASAETELQAACRATWKSYCDAYFSRYGVEPVRNAAVNSSIKSFVQKLPYEEAPHVAAFFVSHNDKFYVQKTHPVFLLLKDAEGLRTQWATGRAMTATRANQLDRTASNFDSVNQAIEMMKRKQHATV